MPRANKAGSAFADTAADLTPRMHRFVLRNAPHLAHLAEDLVQQSLANLLEFVGKRSGRISPEETQAVAFTILRRRIADHHRDTLRRIIQESSNESLPDVASGENIEHATSVRRILWSVLGFLAELDATERTLLLREELPGESMASPLAVADRKRLSRLRNRLRDHVRNSFGMEIEEFFKE